MLGDVRLDELISSAPINGSGPPKVEWTSFAEVLREANVDPGSALAATWCSFGERNIEAEIDSTQLTVMFPFGIVSSVGKRKMFGGTVKFDLVSFGDVRSYGPCDTTDERGFGKYCIEFAGSGGMLLGRLQWHWRAKRFRDSRQEIMAVAAERDRFLEVVTRHLEGPDPVESDTISVEDVPTLHLERLAELHKSGALTDDEFAIAKKKALGI